MKTAVNKPTPQPGFLSKLKSYFLSGLLVSTPLLLTAYLVVWMVRVVDDMVRPLMPNSFAHLYGYFPGYGLIVTLAGATMVGALMKGFLGPYLMKISEGALSQVPFVRSIYATIKQVSQAVLDKESSSFREVGLIQYPRAGIWTLCFITGTTKGEIQEKSSEEVLNVFIPTTPNPTSGILLFVPKQDIKILDMSVEAGIKMVVSLGVITPPYKKTKELESSLNSAQKKK